MSPGQGLKSCAFLASSSSTYFVLCFGEYIFHVLGSSVSGGMSFLISVIFFCLSMNIMSNG